MLVPTLQNAEKQLPFISKLPISIDTRNQSWHLHYEIYKSDCKKAEKFPPNSARSRWLL